MKKNKKWNKTKMSKILSKRKKEKKKKRKKEKKKKRKKKTTKKRGQKSTTTTTHRHAFVFTTVLSVLSQMLPRKPQTQSLFVPHSFSICNE